MFLNKVRWASARILFLLSMSLSMLSFGLLVFPLGPLFSWYFYRDFRFWRCYRRVFPSVFLGYRVLLDWIRFPSYRGAFMVSLTDPPVDSTDLTKVRVRSDWPIADGTCNGCTKCCAMRGCTLLDRENGKCLVYGSFYWKYFSCGRYPSTLYQIEYYSCEKWEIIP
jgi:hypothetical protein